MTQPGLVIQIEKFDLTTDSAQAARVFSDRVSRLARGPLRKIMETASAPYRNQFHALDKLEIDLDEIAEDDFDEDIKNKLLQALKDQFARLFGPEATRNEHVRTGMDSNFLLHALALALQGSDAGQDWRLLQTQLQDMLTSHGAEMVRVLYRIGKKYRVRHNLAYRVEARLLHLFLWTALPQHAQYIIDYHEEIQQIHARKAIVSEPRAGFRAVVWELILGFLFLEDGSYFNSKAMVASTLRQLAARYRIDFKFLLQELSACIDEQNLPRDLMLPRILLELREADDLPPTKHVNRLASNIAQLDAFLLRGSLSWNTGAQGSTRRVQLLLVEIMEQAPHQLVELLERLGNRPQTAKRLARHLDWVTQMQLLETFTPQNADAIGKLLKEITDIQAQKTIVPAAPETFAQELWELVWRYQLSQRGSLFNKRVFLKSLLLGFAARHGLTYLTLLEDLVAKAFSGAQAQFRPSLAQDSWPNLLFSLLQENLPRKERATETDVREIGALRSLLLRHWVVGADSYISMRQGVQDTLSRIAKHYHISPAELLDSFVRGDLRLEQVVYLNRPALRKIIESLLEEHVQQHAESSGVTPVKETWNSKYERAAKEFMIQSLYLDRGSYHNNRSYIKSLLQKIAARHGLNYVSLLLGINALNHGTQGADVLPTILRDLDLEQRKEAHDQSAWFEFFETGEFPGATWKLPSMQIAFKELTSNLEALRAWFRDKANQKEKTEAFLRYFKLDQLRALLHILQPEFAGFMQTYMLAMLQVDGISASVKAELWRYLLKSSAYRHGQTIQHMLVEWNRHFARSMGISVDALHRALSTVSRRLDAERFHVLDDMLESIAMQSETKVDADESGTEIESLEADEESPPLTDCIHGKTATTNADKLLHFLQFADFSGNEKAGDTWQAIHEELLRDSTSLLRQLIPAFAHQQESQCLIRQVPLFVREKILDLLLGPELALFGYCVKIWAALQRQLGFHDVDARSFMLQIFMRSLQGQGQIRLESVVLMMMRRLRKSYSSIQVNEALQLAFDKTDSTANMRRQRFEAAMARAHVELLLPVGGKETAHKRTKPVKDDAIEAGESHYINNAGLVLLWQYLGMLFQRLGWITNGNFNDPVFHSRAVILSQFLVDGKGIAEEGELLLNKILCGMPEETALEVTGPLTDLEMQYANGLLVSVTQQWEKIRNTDIDGLRATFLMRKGRLRKGTDSWQLYVEKGPYDVLMASLPWSISTIKLGWMDKPIMVEWK